MDSRFGIILFLLLFFNVTCSVAETQDKVLLRVHDREITRDEFLYHFHKTNQEISRQNIREYLDLFINYQLKLAQAREERVNHNIAFINELAEYRSLLAAPYLTNKEKELEFIREASFRLAFEVNADHILIGLDPGASPEDTLKAYARAVGIRNRILEGESFEQLALAAPGDPLVARDSGKPAFFTAFQTPYSFETAVYDMDPGEISMPVRTRYGYHIIRLNGRREAKGEAKTENEIKDLIYKAKDERAQKIRDAFVGDLKKYWNFSENPEALEIIRESADESVYKGNWSPAADRPFDEVLFYIDGRGISQNEFIGFMSDQETPYRNLSVREYISSLYRQFVSHRLITYENYKLEEKYPEFRFQYQEYRDAMMLLEITRQKVWSNAESDRAEMKRWIEELRGTYHVKVNEEVLSSIK